MVDNHSTSQDFYGAQEPSYQSALQKLIRSRSSSFPMHSLSLDTDPSVLAEMRDLQLFTLYLQRGINSRPKHYETASTPI